MDIAQCRYIVVEGPIGAGKTSLARQLARPSVPPTCCSSSRRTTRSCPRFYDDMQAFRAAHAAHVPVPARRPAARTSRRWTCSASRRSRTSCSTRTRSSPTSTSSDDEYALYDKVYRHLKPQTPTPDLVIYLQAPVDTLLARVRMRGVSFEQSIPDEYLARLADAYARYLLPIRRRAVAHHQQRATELRGQPVAPAHAALARGSTCEHVREFFNLGQT